MSETITLKEYADKYVTPAMLNLLGWEDTPQNRAKLDQVIQSLPEWDED